VLLRVVGVAQAQAQVLVLVGAGAGAGAPGHSPIKVMIPWLAVAVFCLAQNIY
jgi:hypothetical protein